MLARWWFRISVSLGLSIWPSAFPSPGIDRSQAVAFRGDVGDCQEELAQWNAAIAKIPAGTPSSRMAAIEQIAARLGEDRQPCLGEAMRKALQTELSRWLKIRIADQSQAAPAIYSCPRLTKDLKCVGDVADDTSHLGETLAPVFVPRRREPIQIERSESDAWSGLRIYLAREADLMRSPRYMELTVAKDGMIMVPRLTETMVLLAILKESRSGLYDKFVWIIQPDRRRKPEVAK